LLTRLGRDDDRVVGLMIVPGHMPVGRIIAAEGSAAGLADPEVNPFITRLYTFFTDMLRGLLYFFDGLYM
jgi:hypothetical protein